MNDENKAANSKASTSEAGGAERELVHELLLLAQAAAEPATVLIVDDEPEVVTEIASGLELDDIPTRSANSALEALDILEEDETIAIIISDIRMPEMNGLQFLERLHWRWPQRVFQVIILTGHAGYNEAVDALRLGAFDFIAKPISLGHLSHVIGLAREMLQIKNHDRNLREFLVREITRLNSQIDKLNSEIEVLRRVAKTT
jgi:DNA-binding NtrC family response regulator